MAEHIDVPPSAFTCDGVDAAGRWQPVILLDGVEVWSRDEVEGSRVRARVVAQGHLAKVWRRLLLEG